MEAKKLEKPRRRRISLSYLQMFDMPGNYIEQTTKLRWVDDDHADVIIDADGNVGEDLPEGGWVIGRVARDKLVLQFADALARTEHGGPLFEEELDELVDLDEPLIPDYKRVVGCSPFDQDLLGLCWARFGECQWSYGRSLLQLDDLESLFKAHGTLAHPVVVRMALELDGRA